MAVGVAFRKKKTVLKKAVRKIVLKKAVAKKPVQKKPAPNKSIPNRSGPKTKVPKARVPNATPESALKSVQKIVTNFTPKSRPTISLESPLFKQVLEHIKPTPEEKRIEQEFADRLIRHIDPYLKRGCVPVLTGSIAKGTFLRDRKDFDIFVLFPISTPKDSLESVIVDVMHRSFPDTGYQLSYAEHPYVRFRYEGRKIDLVPAYKISNASQRISAVDRSVLHTDFVKANLHEDQVDDVLLLKAFLKTNSLYGAEIRVQGFSGYLCELLIIWSGSFEQLLRLGAKWNSVGPLSPVFIDIKKYHKGIVAQKNVSKHLGGSLVVIDPTDEDRNVAAALSPKNMDAFAALCKQFIKHPSVDYFLRIPESFEDKLSIAGKGKATFLITMPRPDVVDDVLWGQIRKMFGQMERYLEEFGPSVTLADDNARLVRIGVVLETAQLPAETTIEGPPLDMLKHAEKFRKAHKGARFLMKGGHICAKVKRVDPDAVSAINGFFEAYRSTGSHLAYPTALIVVERV